MKREELSLHEQEYYFLIKLLIIDIILPSEGMTKAYETLTSDLPMSK